LGARFVSVAAIAMVKHTLSRILRILTGERLEADDPFRLEASLSKLEKFAHFSVLLCGSFIRNRCLARAAALSYTTLLAMVPMLAVAVGLSTVFLKNEGQAQIEVFVRGFVERTIPAFTIEEPMLNASSTNLPVANIGTNGVTESTVTNSGAIIEAGANNTNAPPVPLAVNSHKVDAQERAAQYIHDFIQKTSFGSLGVTGVLALLLTAILTIASVENTFNDIWGVAQGRNWPSRVAIYWTTSTLGAVLVAGAALLASGPRFSETRALIEAAPFSDFLLSNALPFLLMCIAFTMLYKLLPNTRIDMNAAWIGGLVAGVGYQSFSALNYLLASRAVGWSKLYGLLALVPLFMFGLYVMWAIVLFGAQVAYAFQNRAAYLQEKLVENVNQRGREFVALRLMTCIGQRFHLGDTPPTVQEISVELGVPSRLIQQVLQTLVAARLVVQVSGTQHAYAPARPLDAMNCHHILLAMRATVGQELLTRDEPVRAEVFGEFSRIQAAEKEAAASVSMLALVNRAQARLLAASAGTELMAADSVSSASSSSLEPGPEIGPQPTLVFPTEEIPTGLDQEEPELAKVAAALDTASAEPKPVEPKTPEPRASSDDDRGFPL
jgi:membrane protein